IVVFKRGKYRSEYDTDFELVGLKVLRSPEEITKVCGKDFNRIQKLVDDTYDEVKKKMPDLSAQDLGNEVHKREAEIINGKWGDDRFKAELTYEKIAPGDGKDRRGAKDSIRLDVHYRDPDTGTICVVEIKTGRKVLDFGRMQEVVNRAAAREENKNANQI